MINLEVLNDTRNAILRLVYSHRVISQSDVITLMESLYPELSSHTTLALSELVQANSIKRYEYTSNENRRDEFYLPYGYKIIL